MTTTDISYIGLIIGLVLMIIPLYYFHLYKVRLTRSTVVATVRMIVQLFLIGLYLKYLFMWNNPFINILWVIIMVLVASFTSLSRTKLKVRYMFIPIAVGLFVSAMVIALYFLLFVIQLKNPFDSQYFIPIVGVLMGNMLGVNVISLSTYFGGLKREHQLYYYLLGNGATQQEAIAPFVRKAINKAFTPCIANMAVMGIVAFPGTMIGQIIAGSSPETAIKYQMMIVVITFCASMLSLMITIRLANIRAFDRYGRLLDI